MNKYKRLKQLAIAMCSLQQVVLASDIEPHYQSIKYLKKYLNSIDKSELSLEDQRNLYILRIFFKRLSQIKENDPELIKQIKSLSIDEENNEINMSALDNIIDIVDIHYQTQPPNEWS